MEWLAANAWIVWLLLAGGLAVSEMLTLDLTLLMLASGALAGAGVAILFPGLIWAQVLVALLVAVAMLFLLRPLLVKRLRNSPGYRSLTANPVGRTGVAVQEITKGSGQVTVSGEVWSARCADAVIAPGTEVEVVAIDGVTAVVAPRYRQLA